MNFCPSGCIFCSLYMAMSKIHNSICIFIPMLHLLGEILVLLVTNQSLACGKKSNRLVCCSWWVGFLCIYSSQTLGAGVTEYVPLRLAQFHLWSGFVNCNRSTSCRVFDVSFLLLALLSVTCGILCDLSLLIFLLSISLVAGLCLWLSWISLAYLMWVLCADSTHMKVPSIASCLFMLAYIW